MNKKISIKARIKKAKHHIYKRKICSRFCKSFSYGFQSSLLFFFVENNQRGVLIISFNLISAQGKNQMNE